MRKLEKYYNEEYSKKSFYVIITALITFVLGLIIYYLAGKAGVAISFVSGVLKPLVLGLVFTYLLSPVVKKLEHKLFSGLKSDAARRIAAVALTFIIVFMALGLILGIIAVTVTKSLSAFNPAEFKDYLLAIADQFSRFWNTIEKQLASMNINLGSAGVWLGRIFNGVKSGASTLLFAVIFAVYFLLDEKICEHRHTYDCGDGTDRKLGRDQEHLGQQVCEQHERTAHHDGCGQHEPVVASQQHTAEVGDDHTDESDDSHECHTDGSEDGGQDEHPPVELPDEPPVYPLLFPLLLLLLLLLFSGSSFLTSFHFAKSSTGASTLYVSPALPTRFVQEDSLYQLLVRSNVHPSTLASAGNLTSVP